MDGTVESEVVSVIVPAHNAARTLRRTLDSALGQTHPAIEVIVVDDGSTDATGEICRAARASDPRVRVVSQPNAGVAAARNAALAAARGALVAPLDADDVWHPEKLARQVAALRAAPRDAGLVYCLARMIDGDDRLVGDCPNPCPEGRVYAPLLNSNFIRSASIPLMRRSLLAEVGGYDDALHARGAQGAEDFKLYLLLAERCRFVCVPEFLVGYRIGPSNMSMRTRQNLRSWHIVAGEARARHPELPGWLFRWAAGNFHRWLSFTALASGDARLGLALLLRAAAEDPGGSLRREVLASSVRVLAARGAEALGLKETVRAAMRPFRREAAERPDAPAFADLDPAKPRLPACPAWEARRMRVASAVPPPRSAWCRVAAAGETAPGASPAGGLIVR